MRLCATKLSNAVVTSHAIGDRERFAGVVDRKCAANVLIVWVSESEIGMNEKVSGECPSI
jgi:hypothetical protein